MSAYPYIIEASVSIDTRTLVFEECIHDAEETLQGRMKTLELLLREALKNPEENQLGFSFDVRPAYGVEVAGTDALETGITHFDTTEEMELHFHEDEDPGDHPDRL